jgi:hypothetical protein
VWIGFHALALMIAGLLILLWGYSYPGASQRNLICLQDYRAGGMYIYTVFRGDFAVVWFPLPPPLFVPNHLEWGTCALSANSATHAIPLLPLIALLSAWGLYPFIPSYRRWRSRNQWDKCRECGYNLTGNVSGICPECGTPLPIPPSAPPTEEPS